jgi:hypothetical protein
MIMMKQSISKMSKNIIVSILILHLLEIHFAEHICIKVCCMFITSPRVEKVYLIPVTYYYIFAAIHLGLLLTFSNANSDSQ